MSVSLLQHAMDGVVADADDKLARLSAGHVGVGAATLRAIDLDHLGGLIGGEDVPRVAIGMTLCLQPSLKMLILLSPEARFDLARAVIGPAGAEVSLADSLLQEIGNILGSCVANALADFLGRGVTTSTPEVGTDLAGAVVACALAHLGHVEETVLLLDLPVLLDGIATDCHTVLLFDAEAGRLLMRGPDDPETGRLS
ncbi:MAG: chemotaxis protein CheC [Planctomycetota bacterium]